MLCLITLVQHYFLLNRVCGWHGTQRRRSLLVFEDQADNFVLNSDSDDPKDLVKRAFFWIALTMVLLVLVHLLTMAVLLLRRRRIPSILRFPRLEMYFFYWAIPAIATASAGLFKGDTGEGPYILHAPDYLS